MTNAEIAETIQRRVALFSTTREPRWRYFRRGDGPLFFWTVEKYDEDAAWMPGMYVSGVYQPVPRGNGTRVELDESTLSGAKLRKDAKARALRLFNQWEKQS